MFIKKLVKILFKINNRCSMDKNIYKIKMKNASISINQAQGKNILN